MGAPALPAKRVAASEDDHILASKRCKGIQAYRACLLRTERRAIGKGGRAALAPLAPQRARHGALRLGGGRICVILLVVCVRRQPISFKACLHLHACAESSGPSLFASIFQELTRQAVHIGVVEKNLLECRFQAESKQLRLDERAEAIVSPATYIDIANSTGLSRFILLLDIFAGNLVRMHVCLLADPAAPLAERSAGSRKSVFFTLRREVGTFNRFRGLVCVNRDELVRMLVCLLADLRFMHFLGAAG